MLSQLCIDKCHLGLRICSMRWARQFKVTWKRDVSPWRTVSAVTTDLGWQQPHNQVSGKRVWGFRVFSHIITPWNMTKTSWDASGLGTTLSHKKYWGVYNFAKSAWGKMNCIRESSQNKKCHFEKNWENYVLFGKDVEADAHTCVLSSIQQG